MVYLGPIKRTLLAWLLLSSAMTHGQSRQDVNTVEQLAAHYALERLSADAPHDRIELNDFKLDPSLILAACDRDLTFELHGNQQNASNVTIRASCPGRWNIYLNARINRWREVLVTNKNLPRKHILRETDLSTREIQLTGNPMDYLSTPELAIGKELKRPSQALSPLKQSALIKPKVVKRGDQLTITAHADGLAVTAMAIALGNGREGDQIRVKNLKSNKIFSAKIVSEGQAEVFY